MPAEASGNTDGPTWAIPLLSLGAGAGLGSLRSCCGWPALEQPAQGRGGTCDSVPHWPHSPCSRGHLSFSTRARQFLGLISLPQARTSRDGARHGPVTQGQQRPNLGTFAGVIQTGKLSAQRGARLGLVCQSRWWPLFSTTQRSPFSVEANRQERRAADGLRGSADELV